MKKVALSITLAAVALLTACSSGVPLDAEYGKGAFYATSEQQGYGVSDGRAGVVGHELSGYSIEDQDKNPPHLSKVIHFEFDSYSVKPQYQSLVQDHASYLKDNPNLKVSLEGHTDEQGGREYNLALGQKRSEAVLKALMLMGVSDSRLEAVSFGEESPLADASTPDAYSQNRRVELLYK